MSDLKSVLPAAPTAHMISELHQQFDALHSQLMQSHVTHVQEEKTKDRLVAERNHALEQVVQLQAHVSDLQKQLQQMSSSHKMEQETLQFRSKQQTDQMEEKVSALTEERDRLRCELEQLHMQQNNETRITVLQQQQQQLMSCATDLQSQLQQVVDQVTGSKKLLNTAKLLIQKKSQSEEAERQHRDRMTHMITDLKHEFAKFTTGETGGTVLTDNEKKLKQENERLQRLLRQVSPWS